MSKNALSSKKINKISLSPTLSAIPFYEKLGFKHTKETMVLTKAGLNLLVKNTPSTHVLLQEEPSSYLIG